MKKKILIIIIIIIFSFLIHIINTKYIIYLTFYLIDILRQKGVAETWLLISPIPLYILPLIWVYTLIYTIKKYKDNRIKWLWLLLPIVFWFPLFVTYVGLGAIP